MDLALKTTYYLFLFVLVLVIVFIILQLSGSGVVNFGVITDPKGASVVTPPDEQPNHVTIECEGTPFQVAGLTRYDYRIKVKDLGIVTQDANLLPVFIFKGFAIAAETVGNNIPSEQGIRIPDPAKDNPQDGTYTFTSLKATALSDFSSIENVIIVFVNADKDIRDLSESGKTCKIEATPLPIPSSENDFRSYYNIGNFTNACSRLIKGIVSVQALNKCMPQEKASLTVTSIASAQANTRVSFKLFSKSGITPEDKVKILINCNNDAAKSIYLPPAENYIHHNPGISKVYDAEVFCNKAGNIKVLQKCSADAVPTCDNDILAEASFDIS